MRSAISRRHHGTLLVLFFLLFAGTAVSATTTLIMVTNNAIDLGEFYDEVIPLFEAMHPDITVERHGVAGQGDGIIENVRVMRATGVQLDVVEIWPEAAGPLFADDMFVDLRPYLADEPDFLDRLAAPRLEAYTWEGKLVGIPLNANVWPLYYNADLLGTVGLAEPPALGAGWNWDALVKYAVRLTLDQTGDGQPDQWGLRMPPGVVQTLVNNAGGLLYDRTDNPRQMRVSSPEGRAGLAFGVSLFTEHRVTRGASPAFRTGNIGLDFSSGPQLMSNLALRHQVPFDWGISKRPLGPDNDGAELKGTGYLIAKSSEHPDAAWKWIRFVTGTPDVIQRMYEITGRIPAYLPALLEYSSYVAVEHGVDPTVLVEIISNPANIVGVRSPYLTELNALFNQVIQRAVKAEISVDEAMVLLEEQGNVILGD